MICYETGEILQNKYVRTINYILFITNCLPAKMVRAWYLSDEIENIKEMNLTLPPQYVSLEDLQQESGVGFFEVTSEKDDTLEKLKRDRCIGAEMGMNEFVGMELKNLYVEHLLTDDVYYLTIAGSGYLDVRDPADKWIRVEVVKGDMVLIRKKAFRRFTADDHYQGKMFMRDEKLRCFARP